MNKRCKEKEKLWPKKSRREFKLWNGKDNKELWPLNKHKCN